MGEFNPNRILLGVKEEAVNGVAETLIDADYNTATYDQEIVQMSADKASVGVKANGTLIDDSVEYMRTNAGTVAVKIPLQKLADPTVEPNFFKVMEAAGFKATVWDNGGTDQVALVYDGKPDCGTITAFSHMWSCDGSRYNKGLRGAVIAEGKVMTEGNGAPYVFTGTMSGAFMAPTVTAAPSAIVATEDAGDAITATGMVNTIDAVPYNITKMEYSLNTTATMVPDSSQADGSNVGYFRIGEGSPTETFTAVPLGDEVADYASYANNTVFDEQVFENDDVKIIISKVQFTDVQDTNEAGLLVQDKPLKTGGIEIQWK